jgi:hypothetical protein
MSRARKHAARRVAAARRTKASRRLPVVRRGPAKQTPVTQRRPVAQRPTLVKPSEAEHRLLALAREMEGLGPDALPRAIRALAAAYAPDAELPKAVQRAWLASRGDKTATLALAWAREQLRLGLEDAIRATPPSARRALPLPAETLAWLLLAACESLAHEPPSAVADRLRLLLELTGRAAPPA